MARLHNFNAGPSILPLPVLQEAQRNLIDHQGLGLSVLEMSHRSPAFEAIVERAMATLRRLLALPDDWEILFLQGGASLQFAMVPLNLGPGGAYVNTGVWAKKAIQEAKLVGCAPQVVWSSEKEGFRSVPQPGEELATDAPWLHITTNNTVVGTQYHQLPDAKAKLVCDMSSDFLARPVDPERTDLVYAGAQKNAGPSGVTVVLGKRDVLRNFRGPATTPTMLRYQTHAEAGSLYNTPPTFGIWLCALVFDWVEAEGGVEAMARRAEERAAMLYEVMDRRQELFRPHAERQSRSWMNVTFNLATPELEQRFLQAAEERGCLGLKGHRLVGGLRASIYNAMPKESVEVLADLMDRWQP